MSTAPAISVCLPVYNGGKFLARAVSSVLKQTYSDFELLIADDCSEDNSVHVIESLAQEDSRIRFWRNPTNVGLFANYNNCLAQSRGKYIKFFAQDDVLHEKCLQSAAKVLDENPNVALVAADRASIDEEGRDISEVTRLASSSLFVQSGRVVGGRQVMRQSLSQGINFIGEPSAVMVRKSHCIDGFNARYHHLGDLDYWLRILRNGDYFFINTILAYVRVHDNSCSTTNIRELLFAPDMVRLLLQFEDLIADFGDSYEKLLRRRCRDYSYHVQYLASKNQVTADVLRANRRDVKDRYLKSNAEAGDVNEWLLDDLLAFREMLFHVMLESHPGESPPITNIPELEGKLRKLLKSPSWKATRWLRDLNAGVPETTDLHSALAARFDEQALYAEHLRTQISRIKQSRSWRLTRRLRKLGIL